MAESPAIPHLIRLQDLSDAQLEEVLADSERLRHEDAGEVLAGRSVGMLFFRPSLRTRTSFEAAAHQLGAQAIHLTASSDFWDLEAREGAVMDGPAPEHVKDAAVVLSAYVDALAIRPALGGQSWENDRRDTTIASWARYARVPVINMESALWHPLQALADLMTLRETLGELRGKRLAIVWSHSTTPSSMAVASSLLQGALRMGMDVGVAHPPGYELDDQVLSEAHALADARGASLRTGLSSPREGARGAHVVYARSWGSLEDYGNPTRDASRRSRHTDWRIDEALLASGEDARFMHAMPVRRNLEVTDEVLDGPRSLIYRQAENRLHSQKALLYRLLRG